MQSHQLFFDEDPFGRITDVHWPPKECPPPPSVFMSQPHYCGHYGWGVMAAPATGEGGGGGTMPFGDNQYPPFVGEVDMTGAENIAGDIEAGVPSGGTVPDAWIPTMTARGNDHAIGVWLDDHNALRFSTYRFFFEAPTADHDPNDDIKDEQVSWRVQMAHGSTYLGQFGSCQPVTSPWIVKTYTIGARWTFTDTAPGMGLGFGFSHTDEPPPEPQFSGGSMGGGSFELEYDYKYWEFWPAYLQGKYEGYSPGGRWDLSLGGPLHFFLYSWNPDWHAWLNPTSNWFGSLIRFGGDSYEWWVTARCGLAFGPPGTPVTPGDPIDPGWIGEGGVSGTSAAGLRLLSEQAYPLITGTSRSLIRPPRFTWQR